MLYAQLRADHRKAMAEFDALLVARDAAEARLTQIQQVLAATVRAQTQDASALQQAQGRLRALDTQQRQVTRERDAARTDVARLQAELQAAHGVAQAWQAKAEELQHRVATPQAPPALLAVLKQLRTAAHPDHWCQGQAANALAHEVSVALNHMLEWWG